MKLTRGGLYILYLLHARDHTRNVQDTDVRNPNAIM